MIRVHAEKNIHDFPSGTRFSTENDYNNLCVWDKHDLLGVFADGMWILVEFCE